jgi:protein tyrosine/serine phosphatase
MSDTIRFFTYKHLPKGKLRDTSREVAILAHHMEENLDGCAEKSAGMRKLLEAKDCFVRAALDTP